MAGNQESAWREAERKFGKDSPEAIEAYNKYAESMAKAGQRPKGR